MRDDRELETYQQLWHGDLDDVHDIIARNGVSVLKKGVPYIIASARNAKANRWRRDVRRRELEERAAEQSDPLIEPSDQVSIESDERELLRNLLNDLPRKELLVVWRRAEGFSYTEIAQEWEALGFGPEPSTSSLRQRHHRTLERLRQHVNDTP